MPLVGARRFTDKNSWEGELVQVDKRAVATVLRKLGDHDRAQQAECMLPRRVDTDRDAILLHRFNVDAKMLADEERLTQR